MSDRRGAQRIDVHLTARYSSDSVSLSGWVANLSRHGLFLRSDFLDETGARAQVDVAIPGDDGGPITLEGEVVRVVEDPGASGMGIRFRDVDPGVRQRLANFMIERSFQAAR
jgi:c-di-GMP-binding flagellar brake protein YcgR